MKKPIIDKDGNLYESHNALCRAQQIHPSTLCSRLKRNMNIEDAVKKVHYGHGMNKQGYVIDETDGTKYETVEEMCRKHNKLSGTFRIRVSRGLTVSQALTKPIHKPAPATDHLNRQFTSVKQMLECNEMPASLYYQRLRNHVTGEEMFKKRLSLDKKLRKVLEDYIDDNENIYDPYGNKFFSLRDLCDAYGLTCSEFKQMLRAGIPYQEIIQDGDDTMINQLKAK